MQPVISFQDFYNAIWSRIPEVWRNADAQNGNVLQVLMTTMAQHFYYTFYLKIAAMDELFDPDLCPPAYLPFLAATINWKLVGSDPISWRNQIRNAPLLYKIKGTKRSITLAEKLIGYSVFMSELWRDYNGNIVPKEQVWNSFPETITQKPWFRTTSPDIQNNIYNDSFSDLLPAFNTGNGFITENGELEILTDEYQTSLGTTSSYDPTTGANSNSKLAKASRINVVLKKDLPLDYTTNGIFTEATLEEAVELFLQFKPFHVYINEMLVMYSLSDYVLGWKGDETGGTGAISTDAVLSRDFADVSVGILPDYDEVDFHNYTITAPLDNINPATSVNDTSLFKGNLTMANAAVALPGITSTYNTTYGITINQYNTTSNVSIENNAAYLTSLGFTLSGYALNTQTNNGKTIWTPNDFTTITNKALSNWAILATTNTQVINVDAGAKTFTRLSGSFILDGFAIGTVFQASGFSHSGNNGIFTISNITALVITCSSATTLVNETSVSSIILTGQSVSVSATSDTFTLNGAATTAGFTVGTAIITTGFVNGANNGTFIISSLTTTSFTCLGYSFVNETAASVSIHSTIGPISFLSSEYINFTYLGITPNNFVDETETVLQNALSPIPNYLFYSYTNSLSNRCSLNELFNTSGSTAITVDNTGWYSDVSAAINAGTGMYNDVISINSTPISAPISLVAAKAIYVSMTGSNPININTVGSVYDPIHNTYTYPAATVNLYTGTLATDITSWIQYLCKNDMLVICKYSANYFLLQNKQHYIYDSVNNKFVFNTYNIICTINASGLVFPATMLSFASNSTIKIVYPTIEGNEPVFNVENITRNTNISSRRRNKKFTRTTFQDTSLLETYIETAKYTPVQYFDDTTGTLLTDTARTRNFKTDLTKVYTRSSIITDDITGTSSNSVNFDPRSPRDVSKWTVYVAPLNEYINAQQLTTTLFSNFFNVLPSNSTIYYDSIDMSDAAQVATRNTPRWQTVLANIASSYPVYFLSSRNNNPARTSIWTRGSAAKMPIPYNSNSRGAIQGFRGDTALFDRATTISNYETSAAPTFVLDKYKYTQLSDDADYTDEYRNPSISDNLTVIPQAEIISSSYLAGDVSTTQIGSNTISYPMVSGLPYTPQYEFPFDFTNRNNYYLNDTTTSLKPSFYANNITINTNPYLGTTLSELDDAYSITITGLISCVDGPFLVENVNTIEFPLTHEDIFVAWTLNTVGNPEINVGLYPVVDYTQATPNVQVYKNGSTLLAYGAYWGLALDPTRIILNSAYVYTPADTITIHYQATDTITIPRYPSYVDGSGSLIICTTSNTQNSTDTNVVPSTFNNSNKTLLVEFPFVHNPIISWYRVDTAEFINTCVDLTKITTGVTKLAIAPIPKMYRDLAIPNVIVSVNGITLSYDTDWKFVSVPSTTNYSYRVVLRQPASQALQPYDIVSIQYTSILNS